MDCEDDATLSLFDGPHLARNRYARALECLDLAAALADAPPASRPALEALAAALAGRSPARADVQRLAACHQPDWPREIERAWQRLIGRRLDARRVPGSLGGEPAAAFLLRGGDRDLAERSIRRHLERHPRDAAGWVVCAAFDPVRAAARAAFHGGPILEEHAGPLLDAIAEDEHAAPGPWLLTYAWLFGQIDLGEIGRALDAQGSLGGPALLLADDAHAFAWYLYVDARGRPVGDEADVEARARLQQISPAAFRRYLRRVAGGALRQ